MTGEIKAIQEAVDTMREYLRKEIEKEYRRLSNSPESELVSKQVEAVIACLAAVTVGLSLKVQRVEQALENLEQELAAAQVRVSSAAAKKSGSN